MTGRDESTEGAHSLGGKVATARFHLQELPQRSSQERAQTTNAGKKRMRGEGHIKSRDSYFDHCNHDRSQPEILCKIALFYAKRVALRN